MQAGDHLGDFLIVAGVGHHGAAACSVGALLGRKGCGTPATPPDPERSGEQGVAGTQLQHTFPCAVHPRREGRGHAQGSLPPRAAEVRTQAARSGKGEVSGLLKAGFAVSGIAELSMAVPGLHTGVEIPRGIPAYRFLEQAREVAGSEIKAGGLVDGVADSCRLGDASSKFVLAEPGTHTGTDAFDELGVEGAPLQVVKELSGWQPLELGELEAESEHEQEFCGNEPSGGSKVLANLPVAARGGEQLDVEVEAGILPCLEQLRDNVYAAQYAALSMKARRRFLASTRPLLRRMESWALSPEAVAVLAEIQLCIG